MGRWPFPPIYTIDCDRKQMTTTVASYGNYEIAKWVGPSRRTCRRGQRAEGGDSMTSPGLCASLTDRSGQVPTPVGWGRNRGALAPGLKHVTTGTLKVDQAFVTCCLDAFTDQPHLYGGSPELKEHYHYLQLIAKHCSDRVAAHTAIAAETQKAESLAKSFAKHVGHVFLAYIDSMNDSLCILTPKIRRELEPGQFSLCEMLNSHEVALEGIEYVGKG
ncbi:hypothetical protein F5J12DRAFT_929918 [Pisolithus orientalis]|uniref:uncharacterized protein n=1 Tax=Pisolithus orientalis TaxID=936130 RepID=UPI002224FCA1|nr:uncharacterized protein F5J12DRAFT_929918 [Pisolithus orientalis]KAI5990056.1 hypothetical protein F5J12DRAFT_929918 [Pisolithus orientalis]